MTLDELLEIGKIVSAQGLKGELRVYSQSDFPERFENPGQRWLLRPGETEPQPVELLSGRYVDGKNLYIVKLAGVEDRTQAEALVGAKLMVPESDRPTLGEDEYHVLDLIGLQVFNQESGEAVGVVVDVFSAGHDLLEVKLHQSPAAVPLESENPEAKAKTAKKRNKQKAAKPPATILIPFVAAIAPIVDIQNGRIEITPPPGLLEINQSV